MKTLLLEKSIPINWCRNSKNKREQSTSISNNKKIAKAPQASTKLNDIRVFFGRSKSVKTGGRGGGELTTVFYLFSNLKNTKILEIRIEYNMD